MFRERLYVLTHSVSGTICAISEDERLMINYIDIFKEYFNKDYKVEKILNLSRIHKILDKYGMYCLHQRGNANRLTLTDWEWEYYEEPFKVLYDEMKNTIVNLTQFSSILKYGEYTRNLGDETDLLAEKLYMITENEYEFIGNLPIEYIKSRILEEPILAHQNNDMIRQQRIIYLEKIYE